MQSIAVAIAMMNPCGSASDLLCWGQHSQALRLRLSFRPGSKIGLQPHVQGGLTRLQKGHPEVSAGSNKY